MRSSAKLDSVVVALVVVVIVGIVVVAPDSPALVVVVIVVAFIGPTLLLVDVAFDALCGGAYFSNGSTLGSVDDDDAHVRVFRDLARTARDGAHTGAR